jgi:carbon-monoxide dehydrogenase small subunit
MAATAYLLENGHPSDEELKDALAGNLCRCGGYKEYIRAIQAAVNKEFGPLPEGGDIHV